jgi:hypothetical protein
MVFQVRTARAFRAAAGKRKAKSPLEGGFQDSQGEVPVKA